MAEKNIVWLRQKDVDDLGQDAGWCNVYRYEPAPPSRGGTLVLHDGPHERVFTESEVRAMVSEMVEGVTAGEELTLETIASKHGVSLDPA